MTEFVLGFVTAATISMVIWCMDLNRDDDEKEIFRNYRSLKRKLKGED